jgi:hypothetical protein
MLLKQSELRAGLRAWCCRLREAQMRGAARKSEAFRSEMHGL